MAGVQRLTFGVFSCLFVLLAFFSSRAFAVSQGVLKTQADAYANCLPYADDANNARSTSEKNAGLFYLCKMFSAQESGGEPPCSAQEHRSAGYYDVRRSDGFDPSLTGHLWWCIPAVCEAGATSAPQTYWTWMDDGSTQCPSSCSAVFHRTSGARNPVTGEGWSAGTFTNTGAKCTADIFGGPVKQKDKPDPCLKDKVHSCYDPFGDRFCASTESGESVCVPRAKGDSGGCISGATGAICVGKDGQPVDKPSDPPIPKDKPPGATDKHEVTKDSTTNNYTTNNYSGTSDGGDAPGSSSGNQNGEGSQSNANGSGNSKGPNGDHGTGADGKCGDGSVPTASGCSGTFTDTGCDTPPACFGDAVLCGGNRELWGIRCATQKMAGKPGSGSSVGEPHDYGGDLDAGGIPRDGGASGDPSVGDVVKDVDIGDDGDGLDHAGLGFGATCPAPVTFEMFDRTFEVPLDRMCDLTRALGYLVLLLSLLAAARIVSGSKA